MVAGHVALFFLIKFKKRKIRDPEKIQGFFVYKVKMLAQLDSEVAERGIYHAWFY
jgi:hypothetical protein